MLVNYYALEQHTKKDRRNHLKKMESNLEAAVAEVSVAKQVHHVKFSLIYTLCLFWLLFSLPLRCPDTPFFCQIVQAKIISAEGAGTVPLRQKNPPKSS